MRVELLYFGVITFLLSVKKNITGITGHSINTVRKIKQGKEN
jgi:hypothetical protein